jgi:Transglutaminase-like superfamily
MKLTLNRLAPVAAVACEFLGFVALYLTPDVDRTFLLFPLVLGLVTGVLGLRLAERWLLLLVVVAIGSGLMLKHSGNPNTALSVLAALIPAHCLLWLAKNERVYRPWRLSLSFLEIVLAAILSPEAHMFVLIFLFVMVGAQALSFAFIETNFRMRDPDALARPVRPIFLASIAGLSCLIFLASLLIFPILPRSNWSGENQGETTAAGFSESVSFRTATIFWTERDSTPVLWIFRGTSKSWRDLLPYGLLRARALSHFNGVEWSDIGGAKPAVDRSTQAKIAVPTVDLEMVRQPLYTAFLPAPYFTQNIVAPDSRINLNKAGEWLSNSAAGKRFAYRAQVGTGGRIFASVDSAQPGQLEVDLKRFPGLIPLAARLGKGALTDKEKIGRVAHFFETEGFAAAIGSVEAATEKSNPVNTFLFETKRGHCELFATAGALLLRAMGVHSRLVVGFRLKAQEDSDVLTVHNNEAHAWVEAWEEGRGWVPVDFTPFLAEESTWLHRVMENFSDLAGAYWNRFIVSYDFAEKGREALQRGFLLLVVAAVIWGVGRKMRQWRQKKRLAGERGQLEAVMLELEEGLVHQAGVFPEHAFATIPGALEWQRAYLELRFGPREPLKEEVAAMRMVARQIVRDTAAKSAQKFEENKTA